MSDPATPGAATPSSAPRSAEQKGRDGSGRVPPFVSGIVLAAGGSRRMGRTKQLMALGETTILQSVIDDALTSRLAEIVVVLGHEAERIRGTLGLPSTGRVRAVVHASWAEGQSGSLRAGLAEADDGAEAAAVLLGDQPGVTGALIDRVLEEAEDCGMPIHRPVHGEETRAVPGHPVVLSRRIWPHLQALSGDEGARALVREHPDWLCAVHVDGPAPMDVDTPEDYDELTGHAR